MMDKFITQAALPTPYQRELLVILMEECAEVQQRAAKALRFGLEDVEQGQDLTDRERLSLEVGDLVHMLWVCIEDDIITEEVVGHGALNKSKKLVQYMQTTKDTQ